MTTIEISIFHIDGYRYHQRPKYDILEFVTKNIEIKQKQVDNQKKDKGSFPTSGETSWKLILVGFEEDFQYDIGLGYYF